MTQIAPPKRRAHRRARPQALGPTGQKRMAQAASRLCCVCRQVHAQQQLLQVAPQGDAQGPEPKRSYVCIAAACMRAMVLRSCRKDDVESALAAFVASTSALATTRLKEAVGLARRQGLLLMGASRIVALRPFDDVLEDEDDDDEEDLTEQGGAGARNSEDTAADVGASAHIGTFAAAPAHGQQDIVLVALDAAARTARSLGPMARPCMLTTAALGAAAGGAPVAAVGIPRGRLALQAAYWLQVWYEARAVLTTPESMMN